MDINRTPAPLRADFPDAHTSSGASAHADQQRIPDGPNGEVHKFVVESTARQTSAERRYLPTLSDLVDRLTIVQQKMIFLPERRPEYVEERALILHDIDVLLAQNGPLNARAVMAITMIQLTNRCIWESESKARAGGSEQDALLKMTHSINGVRNTAKNILSEEAGGRKDYKIDALAADLPPEYGNWNVL